MGQVYGRRRGVKAIGEGEGEGGQVFVARTAAAYVRFGGGGGGGNRAEAARQALMPFSCHSMSSSLELSPVFGSDSCVDEHAAAVRLQSWCSVSMGILTDFAASVLGNAILNTTSCRCLMI